MSLLFFVYFVVAFLRFCFVVVVVVVVAVAVVVVVVNNIDLSCGSSSVLVFPTLSAHVSNIRTRITSFPINGVNSNKH